jgi:metal-responsive CopG/Arc/MetJ family transcriptional regulator
MYSKANKAFWYIRYTQYMGFTRMKHNISITMDQKLFRELENIRGREKRSTFIEHLIILGLKTYRNKNEGFGIKHRKAPFTVLSPIHFSETKQ